MEKQKKVYMSADVLFSPLKINEEQKKKIYAAADVFFFTDIQHGAKQKKVFDLIHGRSSFVSAHGPHEMVARVALCPPLLYTVVQVLVYCWHFC